MDLLGPLGIAVYGGMRFAIKSKLFLHYGIIPCGVVHVNSSYHATLQYTKMSKIGTQRKCQGFLFPLETLKNA